MPVGTVRACHVAPAVTALCLGLGGCSDPPWEAFVHVPQGEVRDLGALTWSPREAVLGSWRLNDHTVALRVRPGTRSVRLQHPEACPLELTPDRHPGRPANVLLKPWVSAPEHVPQVGYDTTFTVSVRLGCEAASAGEVTWRVLEGTPLASRREELRGFVFRGRTRPFGREAPWGVVPVASSEQGLTVLEYTWEGPGHAPVRGTVTVTAAARASGVSSVAQGHRILLGGAGWRVTERPPQGAAEVLAGAPLASLLPDARGRWVLADGDGRTLSLDVARYDDVRLDCGRSDCHRRTADAALRSPMSDALQRALRGPEVNPGACSVGCHTTGEPGVDDGGFEHVSRELGVPFPAHGGGDAWASLPGPLRRLGGAGCVACHGPASLPLREARWAVLRAEVCAVCHDQPPRYGHVDAWRRSRMARADRAPGVGEDPRCRGCHAVDGFLGALRVPATTTHPPGSEGLGVTCTACHAPHAEATGPSLLRVAPWPASLGPEALASSVPSRVCVSCHAPQEGALVEASAASLWLGRGGVEPASGEALAVPAPHAAVPGGCLGCHAGARPGPGQGHDFTVDRARCGPCHTGSAPPEPGAPGALQARAQALWLRLTGTPAGRVPHAVTTPQDLGSPRGRALHDVRLVLEDPAAWVHGGAYARALLDRAERGGR
ncbi:MAG: hypothetical protein HY909_20570 [Deltaproteobacteria bacterium]|nr:hypothetical protein [Deltaproteobacteria bacterium]